MGTFDLEDLNKLNIKLYILFFLKYSNYVFLLVCIFWLVCKLYKNILCNNNHQQVKKLQNNLFFKYFFLNIFLAFTYIVLKYFCSDGNDSEWGSLFYKSFEKKS